MKIISIEEKERLEFLKSFVVKYKNKNDELREWEIVSRQGIKRLKEEIYNNTQYSDGVMILATNKEKDRVCIIKEYRVSAGKYIYSLPAGLSDSEETIESSAKREFKEETGMDLEIFSISKPRYTTVGMSNERCNIVYGYYSGVPSKKYLEPDEDITVELVNKERTKYILENEDIPIRATLLLESFFKLNDFIY